jgi:hypothetical protein
MHRGQRRQSTLLSSASHSSVHPFSLPLFCIAFAFAFLESLGAHVTTMKCFICPLSSGLLVVIRWLSLVGMWVFASTEIVHRVLLSTPPFTNTPSRTARVPTQSVSQFVQCSNLHYLIPKQRRHYSMLHGTSYCEFRLMPTQEACPHSSLPFISTLGLCQYTHSSLQITSVCSRFVPSREMCPHSSLQITSVCSRFVPIHSLIAPDHFCLL